LLNEERARQGLGSVSCDEPGLAVARAHSKDMCERGYFSHTTPDGLSPWDRLAAGGVTYSAAGENIAAGYATAQEVHDGWMNSPGHRSNMLGAFNRTGIGAHRCATGYGTYWTEVLMR
jgi:uncharacterized protein YkwD